MSDCGKYLIVSLATAGPDTLLYYIDLEQNSEINGNMSVKPIVTDGNGSYSVSGHTQKIWKINLTFLEINTVEKTTSTEVAKNLDESADIHRWANKILK